MKKCALIVFAKPPVAGLAKTRLIPALGEVGAANYHAKLLRHTLLNVILKDVVNLSTHTMGDSKQHHRINTQQHTQWDTHLWCSENIDHPFFTACKKKYTVQLHLQSQGDLGERMFQAILNMLNTYEKVCIIGSDCPVLSREKVAKVFDGLQNDADVAITPAEDGGYVLMAVKGKISAELFANVQWGGKHVFQQTLANLQQLSLNPVIQPTLWDVDEPDDIARFEALSPIDKVSTQSAKP